MATYANTSKGLRIFRSIDLDETEEQIKGSAGNVFFARMHNRADAERFVKFYNATAATVTVGTTTPVMTIPLEANSGEVWVVPDGFYFDTAITVAAVTGVADNDTTGAGANEVVVNIGYA